MDRPGRADDTCHRPHVHGWAAKRSAATIASRASPVTQAGTSASTTHTDRVQGDVDRVVTERRFAVDRVVRGEARRGQRTVEVHLAVRLEPGWGAGDAARSRSRTAGLRTMAF